MKVRLTDLNDQQNVGVTGPQFGQEVVEAAAVSRESVEETPGLQSAPGGQRFEYLACLLGGENPREVRGQTGTQSSTEQSQKQTWNSSAFLAETPL